VESTTDGASSVLAREPPKGVDYDDNDIDDVGTESAAESENNPTDDRTASIAAPVPPEKLALMKQVKWLVMDLERRLMMSPLVPSVHCADAGTASSGYLTSLLLEDAVYSGVGSFDGFIEDLKSETIQGFFS
jgi:hypothetical protein